MIIFLTQRSMYDMYGCRCDMLESAYLHFLRDFFSSLSQSVVTIPVSNEPSAVKALTEELSSDLVILTGGGNVVAASSIDGTDISISRELTEGYLYTYASERGIPVLAICRGMQFVNIRLGGEVHQLEGHMGVHSVISENNIHTVNSFHRYGMKERDLSEEVDVAAMSEDGIVEAYGSFKKRLLGVQWHPERKGADRILFMNLCRKYLGLEL